MEIKKYRKKPVEIDAIQWDGNGETFNKIVEFVGDRLCVCEHGKANKIFEQYELAINTLEGKMQVAKYDYIIKGVKGEFYPCKPDIFEQTYETVKILSNEKDRI